MTEAHRLWLGSAAASLVALGVAVLLARGPLHDLGEARAEHQRIVAAASRRAVPLPSPFAPDDAIPAEDAQAAAVALVETLRSRALARGLLVEATTPRRSQQAAAAAETAVSVSGPEATVLRFLADAENGSPLIRLREWRIEALAGSGAVRLSAVAVAPWRPMR